MVEPTEAEAREQPASPGGHAYRRHSSSLASQEGKSRRTSTSRRTSLTQGLKEGGQKVVSAVGGAVGALFKDSRGELLDPEDHPEFVRDQPVWEDELNKYLPETQAYMQPWNASTSSAAGPSAAASPSTSGRPNASGMENVASTSSNPPMIPSKETDNAAFALLFGISKKPQTLAASRWHKAYQFVKRQNAIKRKAMSSPLGTGAKLDGHAFGVIPKDDETRQSIFNFWYQSNAEYWLAFLIAGHIIVLILKAETKFVTSYIPTPKHLNGADIVLTVFYTLEVMSRIFCLGFWQGPDTYLRSSFNKLDFIIVVDSWVHIARTSILGKDAFIRIAILRIFRILLSIRHFNFIGNVLAIMDSIIKSAWQLRTIFVFTIMIMSFYSVVGVLFLGGSLQNRCVRITDNQTSYPERNCITDINNPYGYLCPSELDQYCVPYQNPNWGISSFDNYASGMLVLFQMMTFEGWALQMSSMDDTSGKTNAFYVIFVVIGSYFIVNIYVAAISSIFLRVRHEHQVMEIASLIIFGGEMILRFLAAGGIAGFVDERMNVVDSLVILLSTGSTGFGPHKRYPNLIPIRMLRWFYKKNSHNEDTGENTPISVAIIRSFGSLASVFFFFLLLILVYSIASMELWGGQFSNFDTGYPRANHDTIFQTMLLWFSVTTAESWPNHLWDTMRPGMPYQLHFLDPQLL